MTSISSTNNTTASAPLQTAADKAAKENTASAIQDRFYTLLITQIKNQDPLSPMENSEVTSQMAQLSTLTGIERMNGSLASLSSNMRANMISQGSSVLGRNVVAEGRVVDIAEGSDGMFAMQLPGGVDKLKIDVIDASTGRIAKTFAQNSPEAGYSKFDLNGLPQGRYTLDVHATDVDGNEVEGVTSLVQSRVTSLIPDGDDLTLTLSNGEVTKLSAIQQLSVA